MNVPATALRVRRGVQSCANRKTSRIARMFAGCARQARAALSPEVKSPIWQSVGVGDSPRGGGPRSGEPQVPADRCPDHREGGPRQGEPDGGRRRATRSGAEARGGPQPPVRVWGAKPPCPSAKREDPRPKVSEANPERSGAREGVGPRTCARARASDWKSRAAAKSGGGVVVPRPHDSEAREGRQAGLARFPAPDSRGTGERPPSK